MIAVITASLFGAVSLGGAFWAARVGAHEDSLGMAVMAIGLLFMATGFGTAAVDIAMTLPH